jgi:hypothetical protein
VSDDGPEDTFTALLSVLAPVMTLRAFALGRGLSLARCGFWDAKTTKNDSPWNVLSHITISLRFLTVLDWITWQRGLDAADALCAGACGRRAALPAAHAAADDGAAAGGRAVGGRRAVAAR